MKTKYLLQVGLAFTLLFAGIDSFVHINDWVGFVPAWVENFGVSRELALHLHGGGEIILGLLLLSNWKTRVFAALTALDFLAIIFLNGFGRGIFLETFRDVGLFFTALYLVFQI
ncbi:MAG TPA: DoxX family membrane protein [Patescibacteria group bacterium]|nr:DoxX family membrane protein [Patescibacteria group bacterium]